MNKLYVVRFVFRGIVLENHNFWNEKEALNKICEYGKSGWKFNVAENNEAHKIWEGV